jgi:membrane protein implicated in regulation of membrane protease activity
MLEWLDLSALNCVYFACLGIGVIYAIIILIGGGLSDVNIPDVDVDVGGLDMGGVEAPTASIHVDTGGDVDLGQGEVSVRPLSPISIASFVTAFGAFGIIGTELLQLEGRWSLLLATGGAVVVAVLANLAYAYFLIAPQGSSEVRMSDMMGALGEVITPIPAGNVGEVAIVARGTRLTSSARSADGTAIARGAIVKVTNVVGSVLLVTPIPPGSGTSNR